MSTNKNAALALGEQAAKAGRRWKPLLLPIVYHAIPIRSREIGLFTTFEAVRAVSLAGQRLHYPPQGQQRRAASMRTQKYLVIGGWGKEKDGSADGKKQGA